MMLGTWAGAWLKSGAPLRGRGGRGIGLTLAGLVLQWLHLCPIVKTHPL